MTVADAAVRERALDPGSSFIVQAPAGSGKTELLTRRYLRLLAVVERPEEILAITFTRKAAAEMRARVLTGLAFGAQEDPPSEAHLRQTWELARAARAADSRHGWRLDSHPARLRIQTIDGFNHELARQLPILSGSGAALRIAPDSEPLYAEAVLRVVEHLGTDSEAAPAIEQLIRHLDNRFDDFSALLSELLRRRSHWLDLDLLHGERDALKARLEAALRAAVSERLADLDALWPQTSRAELAELVGAAAVRLAASNPEHPFCGWTARRRFPGGDEVDLSAWQELAGLLLTKDGTWRRRLDRNLGFAPEVRAQKEAALALLEELARADEQLDGELLRRFDEIRRLPPPRYPSARWEILEALLKVLKVATAELELVFRERGETDHVAAELAARLALGSVDEPTDLALRLDWRLGHILVDEFQDTSRSQIRLLRLLTAGWARGDGRTLFLVGDPMQSIYRFREADVGLFLNLKARGLGDVQLEPLSLTVNFRSSRPVIEWVNRTFAGVLPARDDPERGAVRFAASEPRPDALPVGGVHIHPLAGTPEECRRAEAARVADIAAEALRTRPQGRVAILVAGRSHLLQILPALAARQLRYQAVEIDPLKSRTVVQDLLILTRALVHPADRTAWLAVLRAPWCGLTLADLHALAAERPAGRHPPVTVWERMNDPEAVARLSDDGRQRLERTRTVLSLAHGERGRHPLRDWVERTWHSLGGPALTTEVAELGDAEAFLGRLDRLERAGDLEDVTRLEDEIADLYAMPDGGEALPADRPAIEVMTLHKAKGLEFETVILPGLDRQPASDDPPLLRWLEWPRADDTPALIVAPLAARDAEPDALYQWLARIERDRALFERGRQLYVAATRAICDLHLVGVVAAGPQESPTIRPPVRGTFLDLLWTEVRRAFEASLPESPAETQATVMEPPPLRRLPAAWTPPFHELPEDTFAARPLPVIEGTLLPEFDWVSETGRHVGTLVHREIERLCRETGESGDGRRSQAARYRRELAELGVPDDHREAAAQRVQAAVRNLVADERGRWLLGRGETLSDARSELALSGHLGGVFVNGVIDRTFVDREGTRWIVDFKTSVHAGTGLEDFLANEEERYRPQLARYAALMRAWRPDEPVRAALYFPLLKAWREVALD